MPADALDGPPRTPPPSVTRNMPDPETVEKQKAGYERSLNEQLEKGTSVLEQTLRRQREYMESEAERYKAMICAQIDQQTRLQEAAMDQQFDEQVRLIRHQAVQHRSILEQQALQLSLEWRGRKAEEDLVRGHHALAMERELSEAKAVASMRAIASSMPPLADPLPQSPQPFANGAAGGDMSPLGSFRALPQPPQAAYPMSPLGSFRDLTSYSPLPAPLPLAPTNGSFALGPQQQGGYTPPPWMSGSGTPLATPAGSWRPLPGVPTPSGSFVPAPQYNTSTPTGSYVPASRQDPMTPTGSYMPTLLSRPGSYSALPAPTAAQAQAFAAAPLLSNGGNSPLQLPRGAAQSEDFMIRSSAQSGPGSWSSSYVQQMPMSTNSYYGPTVATSPAHVTTSFVQATPAKASSANEASINSMLAPEESMLISEFSTQPSGQQPAAIVNLEGKSPDAAVAPEVSFLVDGVRSSQLSGRRDDMIGDRAPLPGERRPLQQASAAIPPSLLGPNPFDSLPAS
eukprot:gnl/TRDRNA2_/TRDRNA2_135291_c0_seq1.p1 gnl/TRDRNA2_/TRDRNA2_135291_c0~~gnl/TRDRNA2_/TRDRNA2_135291_c0_seq1.p1  ORF type:complete len:586 (+),score=76.17 gnl/TRDRNA2_/TRDRNA2_135291_c0_seq1:227-1759(+)